MPTSSTHAINTHARACARTRVSCHAAEPWAQRYKLVVQVVIGEQRGEGCRVAARCFWDQDADGWAQEAFSNVRALLVGHERRVRAGAPWEAGACASHRRLRMCQ